MQKINPINNTTLCTLSPVFIKQHAIIVPDTTQAKPVETSAPAMQRMRCSLFLIMHLKDLPK